MEVACSMLCAQVRIFRLERSIPVLCVTNGAERFHGVVNDGMAKGATSCTMESRVVGESVDIARLMVGW